MILNTITLHNFMSYGDAMLDLTSCSIACLSGLNGAGKSAILDALTWALWEGARSSSDELIRTGESEMWVDLTFELEGSLYRVRRARQRNAPRAGAKLQSKGTLEFQIWSAGRWKSLTSTSMRETQTKISELLRMDYDTFINSVYLRQGRADEFTMRAPSERKQVLAEILGLSYFDRLQELAREEVRARKAEIDVLQASIKSSKFIPAQVEANADELEALSRSLQTACANLEQSQQRLERVQSELRELASIESKLEPTNARLQELSDDVASLQTAVARYESEISFLMETLANAGELERAAQRFTQLKQRIEHLDNVSLDRQEFETKRLELQSKLAGMRGRMEVELDHLRAQLKTLDKERTQLAKELVSREKLEREYADFKLLVAREAELARKQEAFVQLSKRAEQLHTTIVESKLYLEAELEQKQSSLAELKALVESRSEVESQQQELQGRAAELDKAEVEFESVEQRGIALKQDIDRLSVQIASHEKRLTENHQKVHELEQADSLTMCPLCAAPIVDRSAVAHRYESVNSEIRRQIDELSLQSEQLEQQRAELRTRYMELRRLLDSRKALDMQIGEFNARVSALSRADESFNKLARDIEDISKRLQKQTYAAVERESLVAVKAEMHKLDFDPVVYSSIQSQLRMQRHVEFRFQQLKRDSESMAKLQIEIPALEAKITGIEKQLETGEFGADLKVEIDAVTVKLATFDYDRTEHQHLKQEMAVLIPLADRFRDIESARLRLPLLQSELQTLCEQQNTKQQQGKALAASMDVWNARLQSRERLVQEESELKRSVEASENEKQELGRQIAVCELKRDQLREEHETFTARQIRLNELIAEMNDYEFLSEAFGKKGIQAIIIENAVPEIEAEANSILSRLSDNQMHVALVTQQRTKSGNLVESLEIVIADDMGTRNYELYSGGEAFKINFSIRVALSRLLARRAGAKLQSLIVDEGFGSQDEVSRGRLVKALNAIQPDFARILVVTHIAEIKEMFPVQIQVQKRDGVSNLNLVHLY